MKRTSGHTYPVAQKTNRLTLVVPTIKKEFMDKGTRYYKMIDGRLWDANTYDAKLVPVKGKIIAKFTAIGGNRDGKVMRMLPMSIGPDFEKKRTKVCNKCKEEKSLANFYKAPNSHDGRRNECISCTKERTNFRTSLYKNHDDL